MNAQTPGSDPVYKRLYAFPEMVADLLRSLFPDDALGADYETLRCPGHRGARQHHLHQRRHNGELFHARLGVYEVDDDGAHVAVSTASPSALSQASAARQTCIARRAPAETNSMRRTKAESAR